MNRVTIFFLLILVAAFGPEIGRVSAQETGEATGEESATPQEDTPEESGSGEVKPGATRPDPYGKPATETGTKAETPGDNTAGPEGTDSTVPEGNAVTPGEQPAEMGGEAAPPGEQPAEMGGEAAPPGKTEELPEDVKAIVEDRQPFIKGDLIYPGTRRLLSRFDHIGVGLGASIIKSDVFVSISPGMAWYFDFGLAISAHVPLRLLAVDFEGSDYSFGGLKIRKEDWDEVSDFAKIIRFVTYGRKEARIYATINTMRPTTIGHGMLMSNYQGDIDVDRSLTGLIFDAYNDYTGCQLQVNDITFQNQVFAGLAFVKPLSFFLDDYRSKSLSLGAEYIIDARAPLCVRKSADSDECIRGSGHAAGIDPFTGLTLDDSFVRTDPDTGRFPVKDVVVHAVGGSVEFKFYKDDVADLKLYGTYHQYLNEGGGGGASAGILARLNAGEKWISAFRLRGEYRTFEDGFRPNYFNTLYEIQKYSYLYRLHDYQVAPTKYQQVFGDPDNGFIRTNHGRRHGFNLDVNWGLFKHRRSAKQVALGFGLQESTGPDDTCFYVHLEFPMLEWLQVFGTYMRLDVAGIENLFSDAEDFIVLTGLRLKLFPGFFINAHYSQSFRTIATPGTEMHLGNDTIVDASGDPSPFFVQDRLFEHVHTIFAEIEIGWEFYDDRDEE